MIVKLVRIAFWFTLLFTLAVLGVRVLPYDDSDIQAFASTPELCDGSCFLGIRPHETRVGKAVTVLESHSWIANVRTDARGTGYGEIQWGWSSQQPTWIDASQQGRMTFYWESRDPNAPELADTLIQIIAIHTKIRMYSLQSWYGLPDSSITTIQPDGYLGYSVAYHAPGSAIRLSTALPCPANLLTYWDARTQLILSIGWGTNDYIPHGEMVTYC